MLANLRICSLRAIDCVCNGSARNHAFFLHHSFFYPIFTQLCGLDFLAKLRLVFYGPCELVANAHRETVQLLVVVTSQFARQDVSRCSQLCRDFRVRDPTPSEQRRMVPHGMNQWVTIWMSHGEAIRMRHGGTKSMDGRVLRNGWVDCPTQHDGENGRKRTHLTHTRTHTQQQPSLVVLPNGAVPPKQNWPWQRTSPSTPASVETVPVLHGMTHNTHTHTPPPSRHHISPLLSVRTTHTFSEGILVCSLVWNIHIHTTQHINVPIKGPLYTHTPARQTHSCVYIYTLDSSSSIIYLSSSSSRHPLPVAPSLSLLLMSPSYNKHKELHAYRPLGSCRWPCEH